MKKFLKLTMLGLFAVMLFGDVQAQKKKSKKHSSKKTEVVKFTPREFGTMTSVSDLTDEADSTREYASVKNLIEGNGVTIAYADNTFRAKEPLRRGDFIVSLNSALEAIKKSADTNGLDSSFVIVTPSDQEQSYVTSVGDIKDLNESSIYYPATQSLVEKWGVAPLSKNKTLDPGAVMTEGEVYDVLKATLGYNSPGVNTYSKAMTRGKFAMVLDNAITQKLSEVHQVTGNRTDSLANSHWQQTLTTKQQEKQKADSLFKESELAKIEAQKKQAEGWSKLSEKEKRKQARLAVKNQK
jgi:hypothetical protein